MDKQTQKNLLNIIKKNYEEIAQQFSETRKKHIWPELVSLSYKVKEHDRILDVGCGNGRLLEVFKGKDLYYLGVDNSKRLIELAKTRYPDKKFLEGDIIRLGEISEVNFDFVFCIAVLQHIPGRQMQIDAIRQLRNKVTDDGEVIISVWNMWSQKKFRRLVLKFALLKIIKKNRMDIGDILFSWKNSQGMEVSQRYYHAFRKGELKHICKKAGFKIQRIYNDQYNYYAVLKK